MVQKMKRRFLSSISLLFGMIFSLFSGSKSVTAQDSTVTTPTTIKETPQTWTNFVTPSTIKESPQFLNPTGVKETPQTITNFITPSTIKESPQFLVNTTTPNTVKETPQSFNWLGITMPSATKESPQILTTGQPASN